VVDLQETPAVPPFDPKGDVRIGYHIAGGILVTLGWGFGVVGNLVLHWLAPSGGYRLYRVVIAGSLGPYAWALLGFGLFVGAFGVVLIAVARGAPQGPVVLPGYDY